MGLLKAEWHARTGSTFVVTEAPDGPIGEMPDSQPDAVVCGAQRLGELVESDRILPLPKEVRSSEDLAWSDIYPVVQDGEATYGGKIFAVPFGAPVLTLCYRRDLLEKFNRKPPQTWRDYQDEITFFSDRSRLGEPGADMPPWHAAVEPLAPGWAGQMLLARAAAYARHRDNYSTLFNIDDFRPLIDGPPFVRALEEMVAAAKSSGGDAESANPLRLDPAGVRSALVAGQCAMAITWPTAAGDTRRPAAVLADLGFAELPGSQQSFNFALCGLGSTDHRRADSLAARAGRGTGGCGRVRTGPIRPPLFDC